MKSFYVIGTIAVLLNFEILTTNAQSDEKIEFDSERGHEDREKNVTTSTATPINPEINPNSSDHRDSPESHRPGPPECPPGCFTPKSPRPPPFFHKNRHENDSRALYFKPASPEGPIPHDVTVNVLISVIVLLCVIILGLLLIVYKLKLKTNCNHDDKVEITKIESTSKYNRQLSSESIEVTFTTENSKDDNRYKLMRKESKMSILEPINQDENKSNREEPLTNANTVKKIIHHQANTLHKDQMDEIIRDILKNKKKKEFGSLSSLDKIANEGKTKQADDNPNIDKNASMGILDVVDSSSPLSVKKVISNFETMPSPIPTKKFNKIAAIKPQTVNKTDVKIDSASNSLLRLPVIHTAKVMSSTNEHNFSQDNNPPGKNNGDVEDTDDIYVDTPNNRPVSFDKNDDEYLNNIYDNPQSNKPISNAVDDNLSGIYDNPTNNKNIFEGPNSNNEEIYEIAACEKIDSKNSLLNQKDVQETGTDYDFPASSSKRILTKTDEKSGYTLKLTPDTEPCFDSNYVNARLYHC